MLGPHSSNRKLFQTALKRIREIFTRMDLRARHVVCRSVMLVKKINIITKISGDISYIKGPNM